MVNHQALLPPVMEVRDLTGTVIGFSFSFVGDRDVAKDRSGSCFQGLTVLFLKLSSKRI
jgi:hypothetical protein